MRIAVYQDSGRTEYQQVNKRYLRSCLKEKGVDIIKQIIPTQQLLTLNNHILCLTILLHTHSNCTTLLLELMPIL